MVKFGFGSTKKKQKKKTKAELWQESTAQVIQQTKKQKPNSISSKSSSSNSSTSKDKKKQKGKQQGGSDESNVVTLVRNDSQLSHPDYDPFSADEYIPATKRRSQFDSSVLAMREESNKTSGTIPTYKEGPPEYLNYDNFYPDSNRQESEYREEPGNESWGETGPYRKSTTMYRPPNESLDSSSDEERKRKSKSRNKSKKKVERDNSRFGAPTTLSDVSEDNEKYFRQQETRRKRPNGSLGAKITEFYDSVAEGISDTLSRSFNSVKLFFKTCFWSSGSNRTRG